MKKTKLKGGSLSQVWLMEPDMGHPFVRKQVSLTKNREYGFQRWYSQLKRQERYAKMFPGIFPDVLDYGVLSDSIAYFDMEYIANSITVHDHLLVTDDSKVIDGIVEMLFITFDTMHQHSWKCARNPIELYFHEEVTTKLNDCQGHPDFDKFANADYIIFNGIEVKPITKQLEKFKRYMVEYFTLTDQTFTHGNSTLENILYVPSTKKMVFIDPYEENIIDSPLCEYSQVYQSANSKYELYNAEIPVIGDHTVEMEIPDAPGLELFNLKFRRELNNRLRQDDMRLVDLLEISQFIRMLPFKVQSGNADMMIFFFAHASNLFRVFEERL
ncbi:hypothetical protein LCGC14_1070110 [marine sediment metagenome]|uniref:Aminoglycoside phosphotransferase domain-containing protein n=1 Tax=marine sediment metagenome TaxID=412755 RepID=A0A0F9Q1I1_9ZZZZ